MKIFKKNLYHQLFSIVIIIFIIISACMGIILPKILLPVYEKNIYQYLKQPLELINGEIDKNEISDDVAYLYIDNGNISTSYNFQRIIKIEPNQFLKKINSEYGHFRHLGKTYYYFTLKDEYITKIAFTSDNYISNIKEDIIYTIFPILFLTLIIISGLLVLWSRRLINKIEYLKNKIDNIDSDAYEEKYEYHFDDELKVLSDAIDNMHYNLQKQEEYKNQMYQNISHDFKTPLTVIKSYIEAFEDGMVESEDVSKVVKEQIKKLEMKVHSLLYLNKLNYISQLDNLKTEEIDIVPILNASTQKFKYYRSDLKWKIIIKDKKTMYRGTNDMWEAIIDNLLNNFIRYAQTEIKITIKNNRISFYNDGPNIDENILDQIFTPYKKGIKGEFGLGLSIIKKTVSLCGYSINVKNEKKGVTFMIK